MNLIVAVDEHWGIGRDGGLLVRIPEDMARFRQITMGKTLVMGRRTLETLPSGKPLSGRANIILTRDRGLTVPDARVCRSIPELLEDIDVLPPDDVYVIGGQSVYEQLLPYCQTAYVTKITPSPGNADKFFPHIDRLPGWTFVRCSSGGKYSGMDYTFCEYSHHTAC
jgi:dihydrofolate reductase